MMTISQHDNLETLLSQGESGTLEFRRSLRTPDEMARIMAAFANAEGGKLILGVAEKSSTPRHVEGCDAAVMRKLFDAAVGVLQPPPHAEFKEITQGNEQVVVISVAKATQPVSLHGAVYRRYTDQVRTISAEDLKDILSGGKSAQGNGNSQSNISLNHLATMLADSSKQIERLEQNLQQQQSLSKRLPEWVISAVVGIILSEVSKLLQMHP